MENTNDSMCECEKMERDKDKLIKELVNACKEARMVIEAQNDECCLKSLIDVIEKTEGRE
jgi:hypothetical protein|tara:strand:- start:195 stop:374 length:180 start_codon:yes stop_codon:yes gene_type:complete